MPTVALFLYDDVRARAFAPFALTRPIGELRIGAPLQRERWERVVGARVEAHVTAPHLADFAEPGAAPVLGPGARIPGGAIIANARFVPGLGEKVGAGDVWECAGEVAAVRIATEMLVSDVAGGSRTLASMAPAGAGRAAIRGRWIAHVWEIVRDLRTQLNDDLAVLGPTLDTASPGEALVLPGGPPGALYVERGADIEPYTVFDTSGGPIVIRAGAKVRAFTRIVGPCYIGEGSEVAGGGERVDGCAIGEQCRIHGEISRSIVLGYTNKAHAGFVGDSYLGRWVNLGAETVTSNLKNTYGPVQMWTPAGMRDTELLNLGSLIGDYARTGIGTRLTTGAVVGAGANVFPPGLSPKMIPPFAWGDGMTPFERFALEKFLTVADRQMRRRNVSLGERGRRYLTAVHEQASLVAI